MDTCVWACSTSAPTPATCSSSTRTGARPRCAAYSYKEPLRLAEHLVADGPDAGAVSRSGIDALAAFTAQALVVAEDKGCEDMLAFATSAVRDSANSEEVLEHVRERTGVTIGVLSGEDEARLTFLAVRRWFGWSAGRLAVFDIGGGSLEIAGGSDEAPDVAWSLPLGAARLARDFFGGAAPDDAAIRGLRKQIRADIARDAGHLLRAGSPDHAAATSKTFRSLARICGAAPSGDGVAGAALAAARRAGAVDPQAGRDVARGARRPARGLPEPHPPDRAGRAGGRGRAWTSSTSPSSRSARGRCARACSSSASTRSACWADDRAAGAGRPLHRLGLPRVVGARLRLRRPARLRHRRGDGGHRRAQPADLRDPAALGAPRDPGRGGARALPAVHPAGLGHRAVGQARALGGDGAGGRRRGRRRAPAVPVAEGVRRELRQRHRGAGGVHAASRSRSRTCTRGGPRRAAGMEMYLPGWDPSAEPYANTTIDLSHAAIARSDVVAMAERLGERLRHIHLTDGSGSPKDEHLVPGRGAMGAAGFLRHLSATGFAGEVVVEINTRRCGSRAERAADLRESLEFAREHLGVTTP